MQIVWILISNLGYKAAYLQFTAHNSSMNTRNWLAFLLIVALATNVATAAEPEVEDDDDNPYPSVVCDKLCKNTCKDEACCELATKLCNCVPRGCDDWIKSTSEIDFLEVFSDRSDPLKQLH